MNVGRRDPGGMRASISAWAVFCTVGKSVIARAKAEREMAVVSVAAPYREVAVHLMDFSSSGVGWKGRVVLERRVETYDGVESWLESLEVVNA